MTQAIQIFRNGFKNLRCYIDENNILQVNAEDAAYGLGYIATGKNFIEHVSWDKVKSVLNDSGHSIKNLGADSYIPENMFYLLAMRADDPAAKQFQLWAADQVFPSIRKQGYYAANTKISRKQLIRELGKEVRKSMTAAACRFYDYAKQFGDRRTKGMIIGQWTNEGYSVTGIRKGERDNATAEQLAATILVESAQRESTDSGIAQNYLPHQIEKRTSREIQKLRNGLSSILKNFKLLK